MRPPRFCLLALSACLRVGYDEQPRNPADGGYANQPDTGASTDAEAPFDAAASGDASAKGPTDAAPRIDAGAAIDAAAGFDAGSALDAAQPDPVDAATPMPDAAAVTGCRTVTRDYCLALPSLAEAPVLDGALDCGPALIELVPVGWHSPEAYLGDHPARYASAWRPDGLYFYIEVDDALRLPALASDKDPWCGDGIELYADADGVYVSAPDYDDPGAIQLLATAPARDPSTVLAVDARYHTRSNKRGSDWPASGHITVARANGYALEAFVTAADLALSSWSLAAGAHVGIDIAINVSVGIESERVECGYNLGQYYLRVSSTPCTSDACRPYSNASAFCTPVLE